MHRFTTIVSKNHIPGFTLVETLVAVAVLMIAIVGPFYSVQQAIIASYISRDQLIASSLAQEGAEYIYFERDRNFLQGNVGTDWLTGLDNCRTSKGSLGCTVDPRTYDPEPCTDGACQPLTLNTQTGYYSQDQGLGATKFTRTVKIDDSVTDQARVSVIVTWTSGHQPYVITVNETLYNWL